MENSLLVDLCEWDGVIKQWHRTHYFDPCAVGQLLDGVAVLCIELEQDGHLEGGGLRRHGT